MASEITQGAWQSGDPDQGAWQTVAAPPPVNVYPIDWLRKDVIHGYNCFIQAYVNAKRGGYTPLKLPDGTVF